MNFLGHLFFSNNDTDLMYANIFGDFVKGKDFSNYPIKIQKGIILHRRIDDYIDHHPIVVELIHQLYKPLPKVAGIAIDLYFDHLLAKHWNYYSSISIDAFIANFEQSAPKKEHYDKDKFWFVIERMKAGEWLKHTGSNYGLTKSSEGVSRMISFQNVLNTAPAVFEKFEVEIEKTFKLFMDDAVPYFDNYFKETLDLE